MKLLRVAALVLSIGLTSNAGADEGYLDVNLSLNLVPAEFTARSFKTTGASAEVRPHSVRLQRVSHPGGSDEIGGMVFVRKEGDDQIYIVARKYYKLAVSSPELIAAQAPAEIQSEIDQVTQPPRTACPPAEVPASSPPSGRIPERRILKLSATSALSHDSGHVEKLSIWDECSTEQSITANFKGANCSKRAVSSEFGAFLGDQVPACAAEGLAAIRPGALLQLPLKMVHNGIAGDAAHASQGKSNHNLMRAIDLVSIDLTSKTGSKTEVVSLNYEVAAKAALDEEDGRSLTPTQRNQLKFWRGLRNCWIRAVKARQGSACAENEGCVDWNDRNHRHHLHLSLPLCPRTVGETTFYSDKVKDRK